MVAEGQVSLVVHESLELAAYERLVTYHLADGFGVNGVVFFLQASRLTAFVYKVGPSTSLCTWILCLEWLDYLGEIAARRLSWAV